MMISAGRACLAGRRAPGGVAVASAELPGRMALASADLSGTGGVQAGLAALALGLPAQTFCLTCTASDRAATEAWLALGTGLVLAAGPQWAAAVLAGETRVLAAQSAVAAYPGLELGAADYVEAAYLDLVSAAAAGLDRGDLLALNPPTPRLGGAAARALGFAGPVAVAPEGAGAAGPLCALSDALEQAAPGQTVLLVSYGAGSAADALLVRKEG